MKMRGEFFSFPRKLCLSLRPWLVLMMVVCRRTFLGVGNGTAQLTCNTTSWTNTNWTPGQLYSTYDVTCSPAQLDITPIVSHIKTQG